MPPTDHIGRIVAIRLSLFVVGPVRHEAIEDEIAGGCPGLVGPPSVVHMTDRDRLPSSASSTSASTPRSLRSRLGMPFLSIISLVLLAAPRVILHDLGIIQEGTAIDRKSTRL